MNKKIILVILTIILILAGVGVGVYLVQQSAEIREKAAPATTINLTASNTSPQVGQNVTVDANVDTGENQIAGAQIYINFDVNRLEALQITPGIFFINPSIIGPTINNNLGTVEYTLYLSPSSTPQQGQGILFTISFRTKSAGDATISISPNSKVIASEAGEPYTPEGGKPNVLIGTTPVTINILGETTASPTPTQVQAQATTTLTPTLTPTSQPGVGGNENTPTLTPTRTPTPTQSQSTSSQSVSPTPTVELPPVPESGISIPTIMGITLGVLVIVGSLLLAL